MRRIASVVRRSGRVVRVRTELSVSEAVPTPGKKVGCRGTAGADSILALLRRLGRPASASECARATNRTSAGAVSPLLLDLAERGVIRVLDRGLFEAAQVVPTRKKEVPREIRT